MEGLLVSAATGALNAVTVKLATLLGAEFKHMKDVRKEIQPLSDELNCIHAFLAEISKEENLTDKEKIWMTDVREMSYDIEDSLDDFLIRINNNGKSSEKPNGLSLIKKCRKLLDMMKAHQQISKAIQDFKRQIKEVGDRNQRYMTGLMTTRDANEVVDSRALVIFQEASELVGIDEPKNELISLLTEDGSSSRHQVKVVSIVGFGGLGKTTLANQVYQSLNNRFDCHAFVTVSRNPDMTKVLRTILSDVSGQEYTNTEAGDVQHLIKKISNFLQDKRYFIVVDDLWDSKSWETIKHAFIKNSCGSIIITTTRINEVAESCCSSHWGHIYKLYPLSTVNSRRLFLKRIFGSEEGCPSHLTEVSNDVLKKCDGLPLAIITIVGLLAGKAATFDEWNKVQISFGYALERQSDVNKMLQILSLSYFDLPPHLQSCLLYLSIFREDYEIRKERLVLRWIAEGFIHEKHGFTQYELGERCFNELINRSLIQPWAIGLQRDRLIHDAIRRLSLQGRNEVSDGSTGLQEIMIYSHARAVSVFPGRLDSLPSLQKFKYLRVLDLEDYEGLQAYHLAHLGGLFALRYLSLRRTWINELPEEIGELQYLQTLDLRVTHIKKLPSSIVHLARLVNLLSNSGVQLPDGFGNMQALQWLEDINFWSQLANFTQELCHLRNLRRLKVWTDEFTKDLASSLCTLGTGSLNSLTIGTNEESMNFVMEQWSPIPISLRLFKILGIQLPMVPRWIGSLDNLQHLGLNVDRLGPADFGLLGRLNALSSLRLWVMIEVANRLSSSQETQRVKISGAHGFPSLRMFRVGSINCGFGLLFEVGAMPKLQELHLEFSRDKTESLTNGEFDFGVQHLRCLAIVRCDLGYFINADYEPEHPAWDALKIAVKSNPNHPRLYHGLL